MPTLAHVDLSHAMEHVEHRVRTEERGDRRAWTVREVAKMLGLSRSTVYAMLTRGELGSRRYGKRWIIPDEAVQAFLAGREYEPGAGA